MEAKLEELRIREGFAADDSGRIAAVAHTLRTKTTPFLVDLFRADWARVRFVIGDAFFEEDHLTDLAEGLQALGMQEAEGIIVMPNWWNPKSSDWDEDRMRSSLPVAL